MILRLFSIVVLAAFSLSNAAMAQSGVDSRLNELQRTLAALSTQIEHLKTQNQQLQQKLEKMQTTFGQRIERLEKAPAPKATPARPGTSKH